MNGFKINDLRLTNSRSTWLQISSLGQSGLEKISVRLSSSGLTQLRMNGLKRNGLRSSGSKFT